MIGNKKKPILNFEDMASWIRGMLEDSFKLTPTGKIPQWRGIPDSEWDCSLSATMYGPEEQLTEKNIKWEKEDQGRDVLDIIVGIAIRLGMEQQIRINDDSLWTFLQKKTVDRLYEENYRQYMQIENLKELVGKAFFEGFMDGLCAEDGEDQITAQDAWESSPNRAKLEDL